MTRRAVTLLEIMVVIGLLAVVGAMVLPMTGGFVRASEFRESCHKLETAFTLARAESQHAGEPVRVLAERQNGASSIVMVTMRLRANDHGTPGGMPQRRLGGAGALIGGDETLDEPREPDEGERRRTLAALPESVRLVPLARATPLLAGGRRAADAPVGSDRASEDDLPPGQRAGAPGDDVERLLLAVFFPDGSAVAGQRSLVIGRGGRVAEVEIQPWTGRVRVVERRAEDLLNGEPDEDTALVPGAGGMP